MLDRALQTLTSSHVSLSERNLPQHILSASIPFVKEMHADIHALLVPMLGAEVAEEITTEVLLSNDRRLGVLKFNIVDYFTDHREMTEAEERRVNAYLLSLLPPAPAGPVYEETYPVDAGYIELLTGARDDLHTCQQIIATKVQRLSFLIRCLRVAE